MPDNDQIQSTATLASELIARDLAKPTSEASPDLLAALAKAAAELKRQAGDDPRMAALVGDVEKLIAKNRESPGSV